MFNEKRVLEALMERSGAYADIYVDTRNFTFIQLESGKVEKLEQGEDAGVGLRVIDPWKTYYASTNSFEEDHLISLAQRLSGYTTDRTGQAPAIIDARRQASYPFSISRDPGGVDVRDKLALVRNFETKVRSMEPRIVQVRIMYRDTRQNVTIATTDGGLKLDSRMQVVFTVLLVGRDGSEMQTSYEAAGGFYGFEYFTDEIMGSLAEKTVRRLSGLLGAREAPSGMKTVVLASEADYAWAVDVVQRERLAERCPVLFSPVQGELSPTQLAEWVVRDRLPVRFQLQLHKILWGSERAR